MMSNTAISLISWSYFWYLFVYFLLLGSPIAMVPVAQGV